MNNKDILFQPDLDGIIAHHGPLLTPIGILPVEKYSTYPSGGIEECFLIEPSEIDTPLGRFAVDRLWFYENGTIGAWSTWNNAWEVETLVGPLIVNEISLYENGVLGTCGLTRPLVIKTPAGAMTFYDEVLFHPDGSLRGGDVGEGPDVHTSVGVVNNVIFILFFDTGELQYCYFHPDHPWQMMKSPGQTIAVRNLRFSQDGRLADDEKD